MFSVEGFVPRGGPELHFARSEYGRRLAHTRALMVEQGLDVLVVSNCSNIGYLTGYDTTMSSAYCRLVVPLSGELSVHCSEVEVPSLLLTSVVRPDQIRIFEWTRTESTSVALAELLIDLGYSGSRIGLELGTAETFGTGALDAKTYLAMAKGLPAADLADASLLVLDVRVIKTSVEIEYMKRAGLLTQSGLRAGIEAVDVGVNENDVAAAVYDGLIRAGSQVPSIAPVVITGERTGWLPHVSFNNRRIALGDLVVFELTGTYRRYNAPAMRSAVIGEPTDAIRRLSDVNRETVELLLAAIKPGRTAHDIAVEVGRPSRSIENGWFHGGFGYSIGMGFDPTWTESPLYIAEGDQTELRAGMTFHLPINNTVPGAFGVGFSESVVVTETGCECLTPHEDFVLSVCGPEPIFVG